MDELKRLVESVKLPITLPESAFISLGKRRIPDLNYIMQQYLSPLLAHLDANATAPPRTTGRTSSEPSAPPAIHSTASTEPPGRTVTKVKQQSQTVVAGRA